MQNSVIWLVSEIKATYDSICSVVRKAGTKKYCIFAQQIICNNVILPDTSQFLKK